MPIHGKDDQSNNVHATAGTTNNEKIVNPIPQQPTQSNQSRGPEIPPIPDVSSMYSTQGQPTNQYGTNQSQSQYDWNYLNQGTQSQGYTGEWRGDRYNNDYENVNSNTQDVSNRDNYSWTDHMTGMYAMSASQSSQSLVQFEEALKKLELGKIIPNLTVDIMTLDKNSNVNLAASVLVITVYPDYEKYKLNCMTCFTFVLEASIEALPPRQVPTNEGPIDLYQATSAICDDVMANVVRSAVNEKFKYLRTSTGKQYHLIFGDSAIIPREFDFTDEAKVREVVINALLAARVQFTHHDNSYKELNLGKANPTSATLLQSTHFGRDVTHDVFGNPIRADIKIDVRAQTFNAMRNTVSTKLTSTTGYVDLIYRVTQDYSGYGQQYGMPPVMNTKVYQPTFVITSMFNYRTQTVAGMLQALINTISIQANRFWLNTFMPSPSNSDDLHDIGNIGWDTPLNPQEPNKFGKLDTSLSQFSFSNLNQLADVFFHPGLAFCIDVEECGPYTWAMHPFMSAARGDQNAIIEITDAANILTDNAFSHYYSQYSTTATPAYFYHSGNKILLGTYYRNKATTNGSVVEERDIRDMDYLGVAAYYGSRNRDMIATYTDSMNSSQNWAKRLHHRNLLTSTALGDIKYRGYAERICIENTFINALLAAATQCGYRVMPSNTNQVIGQSRANGDFIAQSVLQPIPTMNIFSANSPMPMYNNWGNQRYNMYPPQY